MWLAMGSRVAAYWLDLVFLHARYRMFPPITYQYIPIRPCVLSHSPRWRRWWTDCSIQETFSRVLIGVWPAEVTVCLSRQHPAETVVIRSLRHDPDRICLSPATPIRSSVKEKPVAPMLRFWSHTPGESHAHCIMTG